MAELQRENGCFIPNCTTEISMSRSYSVSISGVTYRFKKNSCEDHLSSFLASAHPETRVIAINVSQPCVKCNGKFTPQLNEDDYRECYIQECRDAIGVILVGCIKCHKMFDFAQREVCSRYD